VPGSLVGVFIRDIRDSLLFRAIQECTNDLQGRRVSFTLGSFINNVPHAATTTPVVGHIAISIPEHTSSGVLWWALLLGTVLGGNLTPTGASANIVAVGIAQRAGHPVSFGISLEEGRW
jgi:Na+/H+ antiporter NhaD/arsenite permease-like protein